jgi:alkylated DNA repair dioxygenase AlkB
MPQKIAPDGQLALFDAPVLLPPDTPGGFLYREGFLSVAEEARLLEIFKTLPFRPAEYEVEAAGISVEAKRRIMGYGWDSHPELPAWMMPLRDRAAAWVGIEPATLDSALINEYSPGTAIGWHRDKPTHGHVVGVSLGAVCQFRLRRKNGAGWDRFSVPAAPRSVYCMRGESRRDWQHSIPAVSALRYSITFRDF